jgi:glyoxylase-like metal-dependent hydrolase (beta-lactamase superfamily II)
MDTLRICGEIKFWELYRQDVREGYDVVEPSMTFAEKYTLDMGDLQMELVFFGRGHSLSDILVYIPQERLLVTGAIAYQRNHLPEIGERTDMQDLQRFLAVTDSFLAPDVKIDHVVSSHSVPLVKSDLICVRDYYQKMLAGLRAARKEGLTLEQAFQRLALHRAFPTYMVPQPGQWDYGMQERNTRNLWRILQEEEQSWQGKSPTMQQ